MTRICRRCKDVEMTVATSNRMVETRSGNVFVEGLIHLECPVCHAQIEGPEQVDFNAALIKAALLQHREAKCVSSDMLTGSQIRELRNRFHLTQRQAAELFGGGPVAFAKYEAGDTLQSAPMNRLLELCLNLAPVNLLRLSKRYRVSLSDATVAAIVADHDKRSARVSAGRQAHAALSRSMGNWLPKSGLAAANEQQFSSYTEQAPRRSAEPSELMVA